MTQSFILAINPGSTSTKIALFKEEELLLKESIDHSSEELAAFQRIIDQQPLRFRVIMNFLRKNDFQLSQLAAVVGRGGLLTPMASGTYLVNDEMIDYLKQNRLEHASNLGALIAADIAAEAGVQAFIVDPVVVDEMDDLARVTGRPEIRRISIFHALNHKAAAREAARKIGKAYEECRFIVAHLGGGISIGAHKEGRVVDVNNALNGDGPFAPERAGSLPAWGLLEWAFNEKLGLPELKKKLAGNGGLVAHLGTSDLRLVEAQHLKGEAGPSFIYQAMAYNVAKQIASLAAVLEGRIDALVFTGGIAFDRTFLDLVSARVAFLAPIIVIPGEDEMKALANGALRVIKGEENAKKWTFNGGQQ